MRMPMLLFALPAIISPLLLADGASGQPIPNEPDYLNFEQFRNIVDADQISWLTKLKWAGMKYVDAPNANRVVPLFGYDGQAIVDSKCTDDFNSKNRALLVNWAIDSGTVANARAAAGGVPLQNDERWYTLDHLETTNGNDVEWSEFGPVPVWEEVWFSSSCHLQEVVANLDDANLSWYPVQDDKLRWIIENGSADNGYPVKVIVPDNLFESESADHYFAECVREPRGQKGVDKLCNAAGLF